MCFHSAIYYSNIYQDGTYEYQHIILPRELVNLLPVDHMLTEAEWLRLGIRISPTWENYMRHQPEPHVLLFRRPLMRRFTQTFDDF